MFNRYDHNGLILLVNFKPRLIKRNQAHCPESQHFTNVAFREFLAPLGGAQRGF